MSKGIPKEKIIYIVVVITSLLHLIFILSYFIGVYIAGVTYGAAPEYCANGPAARPIHFSVIFPLVAMFLNVGLSLSFDFLMVRRIRSQVRANELIQNSNDYLKIPIRATTFSALCFLPLILFGIVAKMQGSGTGTEIGAYLGQITGITLTVLRAPLTLMITFNSIKTSRARARTLALRDKRLKRALKCAYKSRSQHQEITIETIS